MESQSAGIQYMGEPGATNECIKAIMRLVQFGDKITSVKVITSSNNHGLLLSINEMDLIAIKAGFSSGYGGEGPRGFSCILQLFRSLNIHVEEYHVEENLLERLDDSMLTSEDIKMLQDPKLAKGAKWHAYVFDDDYEMEKEGRLWRNFPPVIPFSIIDIRLIDLAKLFWDSPDDKLLTGYKRLEDIVRIRADLKEHGSKLFSQAFIKGPLGWSDIDEGEKIGRANLFINAYMAHRNPRAHRELEDNSGAQLSEFLLLNHLFILEAQCVGLKDYRNDKS
jgi:hypothetical protein